MENDKDKLLGEVLLCLTKRLHSNISHYVEPGSDTYSIISLLCIIGGVVYDSRHQEELVGKLYRLIKPLDNHLKNSIVELLRSYGIILDVNPRSE